MESNSKRHMCFICGSLVIKLARHLEDIHPKDLFVQEALELPLKSKERRNKFMELSKYGDFLYNMEIIEEGSRDFVLARRLPGCAPEEPVENFVICDLCLGYFKKSCFSQHFKNCRQKIKANCEEFGFRKKNPLMVKNLFPETVAPQSYFESITDKFKCDSISRAVVNDALIMELGLRMFFKYGPCQTVFIRQVMRQLGRLLLKLNEEIEGMPLSLKEFILPQKFDQLVLAVEKIVQIQIFQGAIEFGVPSYAKRIGTALKECHNILLVRAIKNEDYDYQKRLNSFINLFLIEWPRKINFIADKTLNLRKMNQVLLLPLTEDIVKFNLYLKSESGRLQKMLQEQPEVSIWHNLALITLCRNILFNRKRSGEPSKLFIETYNVVVDTSGDSIEILNSLSDFEKGLVATMKLVQIKGKRGRIVPLLFDSQMQESVNLLMRTRKDVGIPNDNPYVFARPFAGSLMHLSGSEALRKMAARSNCQFPERIRSTRLRKHIATISQIVNLSETELDWLARHMGHDIIIHRNFYRLHENTVEVAKVAKLLIAVDEGRIEQYRNKKFEEIATQDDNEAVEDVCSSEDELDDENNDLNIQQRTRKRKFVDSDSEPEEFRGDSDDDTEYFPEEMKKRKLAKANIQPRTPQRKRAKANIQPWTPQCENFIKRKFHIYLYGPADMKLPGKQEIEKVCNDKSAPTSLRDRAWTKIKDYIRNAKLKIVKNLSNRFY